MIRSRKLQLLVMVLISVCTCSLALGAEPNDAKTELKFEIRNDVPPRSQFRVNLRPPFESTHFAVLFVRGDWGRHPTKSVDAILATSAGRTMSQKQRDLVSTLPFRFRDFGQAIGNHTYFRLYGVSEDDTKKMVNAFIEILANRANKEMQHFLSLQQKYQKEIAEIKKKLPEKQKQFKAAESKYKEIKNARYFPHDGGETYKKAKETMLQMDKMLDTLEIELAGIREKLEAIEEYRKEYRRTKGLPRKALSDETVDKLDQMFVEQMVELRGVEARKKAALRIRNREKAFLDLFSQWSNLDSEVNRLKHDLEISENSLRDVEKILADVVPGMLPQLLPPKVFQNKVTIYPVR